MTNLMDTILSSIPGNAGDLLGSALGDSPNGSLKAMSAVVPLLLSAFAGKAASGGDLGNIFSMISGSLAGGNPLDNPAALLGGAPPTSGIGGLAQQLLGNNMGPIATAIGGLFGVKPQTVTSLMAFAGPMIAGGIGKVLGPNLSLTGLAKLLMSEKGSFDAALPAPLRQFVAAPAAAPVPERDGPKAGWLKWLLLALGLLGLLWFLFGRAKPEAPVETVAVETTEVVAATPDATAPAAIPEGAGVLAESRAGLPVLVVFFDVGQSAVSNNLGTESSALKAYADANPTSRISVSGYNDPTGDAAANAALAKSRAEAVKGALVTAGIPADRIDLDKPVAPTDNSDSYAAARRVEVTVKN